MPFFKNLKKNTVVYRKFEINTEVLDGEIQPINNEICYLLYHVPNNKWSFNVKKIGEGYPEEFKEYIINYKEVTTDKPIPYYTVVLKSDFENYLKENSFNEIKENKGVIENIINIEIPQKETKPKVNESIKLKGITLVRDSEPLIYKYKSPNER